MEDKIQKKNSGRKKKKVGYALFLSYFHHLLEFFFFLVPLWKTGLYIGRVSAPFLKFFNSWPLLVWQCTSRSTYIIRYTFLVIHIFPTIFSKIHLLHFAVYLILTGIRICDSSKPTMHSGHPMIIESGIHPRSYIINCTYLAFQGHCQRVTHSFLNIIPWTSLLLALSGDIGLNPGPTSRSKYLFYPEKVNFG